MTIAENATFDYIIAGAGAAGCVLANRLSADPRVRVCLVEAGASDRGPLVRAKVDLPVGNTILLSSPKYNWGYFYAGEAGLHHDGVAAHRGRLTGGSSAVNGMVYMRGQPRDFDGWAAAGNPGWSYDEVLPFFKQHENHERGADAFHGTGGELNVAPLRWVNPLTRAFIAAAGETQFQHNPDFNGAAQDGFGTQEVTQRNGRRWSSARAFLDPVRHRRNLTILHDTLSLRVRFAGRRAVGMRVRHDGAERDLAARREVILAAGAFNSPQLLLLSGVGPAASLHTYGIDLVHDLPGVGENLHDHPCVWVRMEDRSARSYALTARALPWLAAGVLSYVLLRRGPFTSNGVEGGGFIRTRPDLPAPDLQFVFMPALKDFRRWVPRVHGFGLGATLLQPKSRGAVVLRSPDPAEPPLLRARFLDHPDDLAALVRGVRIGRQILAAPALAAARGKELMPGADVTSTEALETYARNTLQTSFHPAGTCKMGPASDPMAVVDAQLRVRGLEGLRVIDASIMPTVVSGNTNAPTMMIAERGAAFIAAAA
jgi:choline dehydrogenase-like flavoprotein